MTNIKNNSLLLGQQVKTEHISADLYNSKLQVTHSDKLMSLPLFKNPNSSITSQDRKSGNDGGLQACPLQQPNLQVSNSLGLLGQPFARATAYLPQPLDIGKPDNLVFLRKKNGET